VGDYPLLNLFLTMFWFFMWCVWIFMVIWTIILIFRSHDLSGWAKAAWVILVIFLPLVGVLAYLAIHGRHLADEASDYSSAQEAAYQDATSQDYARMEMRGPRSADEVTKLADLHDRGVITDDEFRKGKDQLFT
jgi:hypothetical protein